MSQNRVSPNFHIWATLFDLINTSHLNPQRVKSLSRILQFHQGYPKEMRQVWRSILFPHFREMQLDQTKLKSTPWVWLEYPFHWVKHVINLTMRY